MRENLLILGLVFFATLSGVLFWKNQPLSASQVTANQVKLSPPEPAAGWMNVVALNTPEKYALILCSDSVRCNSCLMAETADWQKWLSEDTTRQSACVKLVCVSHRPSELRRDIKVSGVRYEILFDSTGAISKSLNAMHSPEVFFCYKRRTTDF